MAKKPKDEPTADFPFTAKEIAALTSLAALGVAILQGGIRIGVEPGDTERAERIANTLHLADHQLDKIGPEKWRALYHKCKRIVDEKFPELRTAVLYQPEPSDDVH